MAITRLKPTGVNSASNFTFANVTSTGNVTATYLVGSHSGDGSALTNISGSNVTGTVSSATPATTATSATTSGTVTTAAQPNITSTGPLTSLTAGALTTTGWTSIQQAKEKINVVASPTGTVTYDTTNGSLFYNTGVSGNITANFTNVPTTANTAIVVGLFLEQTGTPGYANVLQINSNAVTIYWPSATAPTATASRHEVQSFTLIYTNSTWTAYSQLASYG